jgi:hypothetical protein
MTNLCSPCDDVEAAKARKAPKAILTERLRPTDEGYLLPGTHHDGSLRNVILALDPEAKAGQVYQLWNPAWAEGIAVVRLGDTSVTRLLATSDSRKEALASLRATIKNELVDSRVSVGPRLSAAGNHDHEDDDWECGFDGEHCSAGLYSAMEDRAPSQQGRTARLGTTRGHPAHYLVVRAGAGKAAEEFHGKLIERLGHGSSIEEALIGIAEEMKLEGGVEGLLKRLTAAGKRNRARIMLKIATALGIEAELMTSLDHGSNPSHGTRQMAALDVDTVTNVFERSGVASGESGRNNYIAYFGGTTAPKSSQGIAICSNVAEGFFLFRAPTNAIEGSSVRSSSTMAIQNNTYGSIPFTSELLVRDSSIMSELEQTYRERVCKQGAALKGMEMCMRSWMNPTERSWRLFFL